MNLIAVAVVTASLATPAAAMGVSDAQTCLDNNIKTALGAKSSSELNRVMDMQSLTASAVGQGWDRLNDQDWNEAVSTALSTLFKKVKAERSRFIGFAVSVNRTKNKSGRHHIVYGTVTSGEFSGADFEVNLRTSCRIMSIKLADTFMSASIWTWLRNQRPMHKFQDLAVEAIKKKTPKRS